MKELVTRSSADADKPARRVCRSVKVTKHGIPFDMLGMVSYWCAISKKVHILDIAPLRSESPPQKRSGIPRVVKEFHSFTCTSTRTSAIGMSHTCLCLPSRSWYSFTDPGGMEG